MSGNVKRSSAALTTTERETSALVSMFRCNEAEDLGCSSCSYLLYPQQITVLWLIFFSAVL